MVHERFCKGCNMCVCVCVVLYQVRVWITNHNDPLTVKVKEKNTTHEQIINLLILLMGAPVFVSHRFGTGRHADILLAVPFSMLRQSWITRSTIYTWWAHRGKYHNLSETLRLHTVRFPVRNRIGKSYVFSAHQRSSICEVISGIHICRIDVKAGQPR